MPTDVHFIGAEEPVRLDDDYQKVMSDLHGNDTGHFTLSSGGLATVYRSSIAYFEDVAGSEPSFERV